MNKINICGIPFDNVTMREAVALADDALQKEGVSVVVTPNAEIAEMCIEDPAVCEIILKAQIILPDGAGIITAAEILGTPLREKVAGVEFGMELIRHAVKHDYSLFFLGGKPGVAKNAAEKLKATYTKLKITGTHDGYFEKTGEENDAVIKEINDSGADILFVCLGAPAQETWIMKNREKLISVRLAACLGGSLDIYAGTTKRAPKLFIKLRLEWFYRLLREPKRLGRMMKIPKYLRHVKKEARNQKAKK